VSIFGRLDLATCVEPSDVVKQTLARSRLFSQRPPSKP
jgi:hypothetical protein